MNRMRLHRPLRQQTFDFTSHEIGSRLPRATYRKIQALLAQLLVEVLEADNDTQRSEDERQNR